MIGTDNFNKKKENLFIKYKNNKISIKLVLIITLIILFFLKENFT